MTRSSAIVVIADRTACSILTLFIVTATSRPLNKKIRLLSIRRSNNYCGSASAIRSPHTSVCTCSRRGKACAINSTGLGRRSHRVIVDNEPTHSLSPIYTVMAFLACVSSFFVVHFVAKRYILQQKCQKGQIGTCMLGTRSCNF